MLIACRRPLPYEKRVVTTGRQVDRAWQMEKRAESGHQDRLVRAFSVTSGLHIPRYAGRVIKKCSLAVIGEVPVATSRIQGFESYRHIRQDTCANNFFDEMKPWITP